MKNKKEIVNVIYIMAVLFALLGAMVFQYAQGSWVIGTGFLFVLALHIEKSYNYFTGKDL